MDRLTRRQALQRGGATALTLGGLPVTRTVADPAASGRQSNEPESRIASIPIYDAQGYFVENELDRYSVNSFMLDSGQLHTEANELVVYVQHEKPDDPGNVKNWLPAPEGGMRFAARFYGPHWSLVDGSYDMPAVVPVEG